MNLQEVLQRQDIWRGSTSVAPAEHLLPTGHAVLDEAIGGWPRGALIELLSDHTGIGEFSLLLPTLATLARERHIALIAPPHIPHATALATAGIDPARVLWLHPAHATDALWAMEQTLRSGVCSAVLGWPGHIDQRALRRLQLAAEQGDTLAVLYRPLHAADAASPAALRLELQASTHGLRVQVRKRRGGWTPAAFCIQR